MTRFSTGRPRNHLPWIAVACCALVALVPASAGADVFSGISLVSFGSVDGGPLAQAEYAHDAAISADGRYVVFDGAVGGVQGVWRRNTATSAIEQVAGGGAREPSVSSDGRYVSFTTDEGAHLPELSDGLAHATSPEPTNVYVRDMADSPAATAAEEATRAPGERAFRIVSAPSGSEQPLHAIEKPGSVTEGAFAVGRSAISADGQRVVFATEAISNLVPYPALEEEERSLGETPRPHTPPRQVAVRYMETGVTELVTRCRSGCGLGPAAGAAEPVAASLEAGEPVGGVAIGGASISADGSTVAWNGANLGQQVQLLSAEFLTPGYSEPLWERLPAAGNATRRVSGGSDPENPACAASGETSVPTRSENPADPCQGPFEIEPGSGGDKGGFLDRVTPAGAHDSATPQLSADGEEVAFVSEAVPVSEQGDFGRLGSGAPRDVYVAHMGPGLTRVQALQQLTQVGVPEVPAEDGPVVDFAISPDGSQVAFSTIRTIFLLGEPTLVSAAPPFPGINELYDADLQNGTITLVTHGYEGGASTQPHRNRPLEEDPYEPSVGAQLGTYSESFDGTGHTLAFTSTADNLVYGDGNTPTSAEPVLGAADGADVFDVSRITFQPQPASQQVAAAPTFTTEPSWRMGVTAARQRNGTVLLYVRVPGSGALAASARSAVLVTVAKGKRAHRRARRVVAQRGVASAHTLAQAPQGALVTLVLKPAKAYAPLAARGAGLSANVSVAFSAPGEPKLTETLAVTFKSPTHKTKKARRAASGSTGAHAR